MYAEINTLSLCLLCASFPCVNKSRNLYSLFLKLVAPNYEVWYFGAKSTILWETKIFSSHLHSIIDKACATASSWDVLYPTHKHCTSTYVVVQFYPWFKFSFLLFQTHYHVIIIHYNTEKQKKIKFEPRIKLNHNTYTFKQYFRHASLTWFVFPNIWPCDCHNLLIILWYVSCHPWTDLLPSDLNGNSTPKSMVRNQYVRQRQLSYVASIEESFLLNMYRSQPNELLFWMAVEVVVWSAYKCHATLNSRKEITDFPLLIQLVDLQNLTCTVYYYYSFSY